MCLALVGGLAGLTAVNMPATAGDDDCYYSSYGEWIAGYDSYCSRSLYTVYKSTVPVWPSFGYPSGTKEPASLILHAPTTTTRIDVVIGTKKLGSIAKTTTFSAPNAMMRSIIAGLRQKKNLVLTLVHEPTSKLPKATYTISGDKFEEAYQRMAQ